MTTKTRTACQLKPAAEILNTFVDWARSRNVQTVEGYLGIDGHTTDAELRATARGLRLDAADAGHLVTVPEALAYVTEVRARIQFADAARANRHSTERRFPGFGQDWR